MQAQFRCSGTASFSNVFTYASPDITGEAAKPLASSTEYGWGGRLKGRSLPFVSGALLLLGLFSVAASAMAAPPVCANQLNLEVWNPNQPANQDQIAVRITNWGGQPVPLNQITVKAYIDLGAQGTLQGASYANNQQVFNSGNTWLANVLQPTVSFNALGSLFNCSAGREADTVISVSFTDPASTVLPANGGYVQTNSGSTLAGWNLTTWANLVRANDYSAIPAADNSAATRVNLIYYTLYLNGVLQSEWTSPAAPDPNSGRQPCGVSGASCIPPSATPTGTSTATLTSTSAATRTDSPTAIPTGTSTATLTDTSATTQTDSPTATLTDTSAMTRTDSPTATLTDTSTKTPTDSPTATLTDTSAATRTDSPTATPSGTSTTILTDSPTATPTDTSTAILTGSPTRTPIGTPTVSLNPVCANQLNLEVWNPNQPANQDQIAVRITNWGGQPVPLNQITVKAYIDLGAQGTLQGAAYANNQQVFTSGNIWLANVLQPTVSFNALGSLFNCSAGREADTMISVSFTDPASTMLPANGGYVQTNSGSTLAGWNLTTWANLVRANDYSAVPGADNSAATRVNLIYYTLYLNGVLQSEWTSPATHDPNSGRQPCGVSGLSCIPPSATPTGTSTATPTDTSTATLTGTSTATPTNTSTATRTDSPTATLTDTSTATRTGSPSATSTDTSAATRTDSPTATLTDTSTATRTDSPSVTLTSTSTATRTDSPMASPTASRTSTSTGTVSDSPTASRTSTSTGTVSDSPTVSLTGTPTGTRTDSPTATPTRTSTATHTDSPTATITGTSTATRTVSPTSTQTLIPIAACGNQLNLEVWNPNQPANQDQIAVRITNWGGQPVPLNQIMVKAYIYVGGQGTLQGAAYANNQQVFTSGNTWLGNVLQPTVSFSSLGSLLNCSEGREADTAISISFTDPASTVLPANGGYVQTNGGSTLAGWNLTTWANLVRIYDYSSVIPATNNSAATRVNLIYYTLYLNGVLQSEWTSATAQDPNSGRQPCGVSGASCISPATAGAVLSNPGAASVSAANGKQTSGNGLVGVTGVIAVPNPAASEVTVFARLLVPGQATIDVMNLGGQLVYSSDLGQQPAGVLSRQFSVGNLASGIYFVTVTSTEAGTLHTIGTFKLAVVH